MSSKENINECRDLSQAQFQEELDRWFQRRGIISDLRSHLRHLMVMALQNTQIGPKSSDESSPKAQALNLLVAEYLLRHKCHYTLSVFTSEVPALTDFSRSLYCRMSVRQDISSNCQKINRSKACCQENNNAFQEIKVDEIFNALGLPSSTKETKRLKIAYLQKTNEMSLLELLLHMVLEMSVKLDIQQYIEVHQSELNKGFLSDRWAADLVDILLNEKINLSQIMSIQKSISSITEIEFKNFTEKEKKKQVKFLAEREKRIQENLKKYEEDILLKLMEAEKELIVRKDCIDEELAERQRHLSKMAIEWNAKHQEIIQLSKNFYNIRNENKMLREKLDQLELENKHFKDQEQKQNEIINSLRSEIKSLKKKWKEESESNILFNQHTDPLTNIKRNAIFSADEDAGKVALNLPSNVESFSYDFRDLLHNQASQTNLPFIFPDEGKDENIFLMQSPTEEIVLSARKTLEYLEKESERINKKYLQYKMKYKSILVSASESSICSSSDAEMRDVETMLCSESPVLVLKLGKSAQTGQENTTHEVKGLEENGKVDSDIEYNIKRYTEENFPTFSIKGTSTKRQLQNREYFLKSRKLLEEIEKQNEENLQKTSILNSPLQNSISSSTERFIRSSDETEKEKTKNIFEKPVAHNSLNNSLFYGRNAVLQSEEKLLPESNGTDIRSLEARADLGCLELLSKSEVKSEEVIPSRNMLRQQILFASTNDDEEPESKSKQINKGVKIIKSPVLGLPSPNFSASSENASMGRDSPGGDF